MVSACFGTPSPTPATCGSDSKQETRLLVQPCCSGLLTGARRYRGRGVTISAIKVYCGHANRSIDPIAGGNRPNPCQKTVRRGCLY